MKNKILYGLRWQAAFPIYWVCCEYLGVIAGTIIAGIIGALTFYNVDKILTKDRTGEQQHGQSRP
jgi:hypothetical protein